MSLGGGHLRGGGEVIILPTTGCIPCNEMLYLNGNTNLLLHAQPEEDHKYKCKWIGLDTNEYTLHNSIYVKFNAEQHCTANKGRTLESIKTNKRGISIKFWMLYNLGGKEESQLERGRQDAGVLGVLAGLSPDLDGSYRAVSGHTHLFLYMLACYIVFIL